MQNKLQNRMLVKLDPKQGAPASHHRYKTNNKGW